MKKRNLTLRELRDFALEHSDKVFNVNEVDT
jgi:hypothetical protein